MRSAKLTLFSHRLKRRFFSNIILARIILAFIFLVAIIVGYFIFFRQIKNPFPGFSFLGGKALPQINGRTNFLLLGSGGIGHAGADLSDSLIFISVNAGTNKVTLISVPRDLWINSLQAKINTAFHYGYQKAATSGGLLLSKSAVAEAIGQPVHFVIYLDFSTFVSAIDILGGLDLVVDRAFDDYKYPVPGKENDSCSQDPEYGCRYEHVHFESGPQHMDGQTALKYVRSRHSADPDEGTDFSRSKRQSKVISAVKAKLTSFETLKKPEIYSRLYQLISSSIISDVTPSYYASLFRLGLKLRHSQIYSYSLSVPEQLENPSDSSHFGGQWVLIPKDNNSGAVYDFVSRILDSPK